MIELSDYEKKWILVCKGHFKEQYPSTGYFHTTLKPLWTEIYGWNPDEDNNYHDYLNGCFKNLLSIMLKIKTEWSSTNGQLEELFDLVFSKRWNDDAELPIERGINKLCSLIGNTEIVKNGVERFSLELDNNK